MLRNLLLFALAIALFGGRDQGGSASGATTQVAQSTALVSGRVVDAATRQPIPDAIVSLSPYGGQPPPRILTDENGRFTFRSLRAADYRLAATAAGYMEGGFGIGHPLGAPKRLTVSANQANGAIEIRLWPLGAIRGRVTDEQGEPVEGVFVRAFRLADDVEEVLNVRSVRAASTDDRGEFAITGLLPGNYVVATVFATATLPDSTAAAERVGGPGGGGAQSAPGGPGGPRVTATVTPTIRVGPALVRASSATGLDSVALVDSGARPAVRPTVYYPAAAAASTAETIAIGPGVIRRGVDLIVRTVPSAFVSGRIIGAPLPATLRLRRIDAADPLIAEDPFENPTVDVGRATTDASGAFVFAGVPAGQHVIVLEQQSAVRNGTTSPAVWARASVTVTEGTDVSNVVVSAAAGLRVAGRVQLQDGETDAAALSRVEVFLNSPGRNTVKATMTGGAFVAEELLPGPYTLFVNAPAGLAIGWIVRGGQRVPSRPIDVEQNIENLTLVLTRRLSRIDGAIGPEIQPVRVLLFPAAAGDWSNSARGQSDLRMTIPDASGVFSATGLPPGEYFVIAVPEERFDPRWRQASFLRGLSAAAARVTVAPGETKRVTPPVLPKSR